MNDLYRHEQVKEKTNEELMLTIYKALIQEQSKKELDRILEGQKEGVKISWEYLQTTKLYNR